MGDKTQRSATYAGLASTGAAVMSLLTYLKTQQASADGNLVLPEELLTLLASWAATTDSIYQELQNLGINVQGFPPNGKGIMTPTIICANANQAYRGPNMTIEEGYKLVIKSHPLNPFGSIVRVASSSADATNNNSSFPLAVNDICEQQVDNMQDIYVSATIAGCIAALAVEKLV